MMDNVLQRVSSCEPIGGIAFRENEELKNSNTVVKEFSTPLAEEPSTSKSFKAM